MRLELGDGVGEPIAFGILGTIVRTRGERGFVGGDGGGWRRQGDAPGLMTADAESRASRNATNLACRAHP